MCFQYCLVGVLIILKRKLTATSILEWLTAQWLWQAIPSDVKVETNSSVQPLLFCCWCDFHWRPGESNENKLDRIEV